MGWFEQTTDACENNVSGSLYIGYRLDGEGMYKMNDADAALTAGQIIVGVQGKGTFDHNSGTVEAAYVSVGHCAYAEATDPSVSARYGLYDMDGGELTVAESATVQSGGTLTFGADGCFVSQGFTDLADATIDADGDGTFEIASTSLVVFPSGFDPDTEFATFDNDGAFGVKNGDPATIPSGMDLDLTGKVDCGIVNNGDITTGEAGFAFRAPVENKSGATITAEGHTQFLKMVKNAGTISADPGVYVRLDGGLDLDGGSVEAYWVQDDPDDPNSSVNISGGALDASWEFIFSGTQTGGTNEVTAVMGIDGHDSTAGCYSISGGTLKVDELLVGGSTDAEFRIADSDAVVTITHKLTFNEHAAFTVSQTASVLTARLNDGDETGGIEIAGTDHDALAGLGNLTLKCEFDSGDSGENNVLSLQAAGADPDGDAVTGDFITGNFVMYKLILGVDPQTAGTSAGRITLKLVDDVDNGNQTESLGEVVFVKSLEILAGANLDFGSKNDPRSKLYFDSISPKRLYPGDANLDGVVDIVDLGILAENYETECGEFGWAWANGDFNGDRVVDILDLGIVAEYYGSGESMQGGGGEESSWSGGVRPPSTITDYDEDGVIGIEDVRQFLADYGPSGQEQ